jgi:hypothetical protein
MIVVATAIGLVATFAVPWYELRGAFAAWRIVEWHTFWRGADAFQLASVVASDYHVPIEYATTAMQNTLHEVFVIGSALGVWHIGAAMGLLIAGTRIRRRAGISKLRVALEIGALIAVNTLALYLLAWLLASPSNITTKVDFRSAGDIHTDTLIWSSLDIFPIAPVLSLAAFVIQLFWFARWARRKTN